MTTPFTYRISWTKIDKHYYGVRYKKGCKPSDLWNSYFTSSKHVSRLRENFGEPDVIQIRKTFEDKQSALEWEQKVLKRLQVKSNNKWLNVAIGKPTNLGKKHSEETRAKMRKPKPKWFGVVVSEKLKLYVKTEEHCKNISEALKGRKLNRESVEKREKTRKINRELGLHKPRKKGYKRSPYKKKNRGQNVGN